MLPLPYFVVKHFKYYSWYTHICLPLLTSLLAPNFHIHAFDCFTCICLTCVYLWVPNPKQTGLLNPLRFPGSCDFWDSIFSPPFPLNLEPQPTCVQSIEQMQSYFLLFKINIIFPSDAIQASQLQFLFSIEWMLHNFLTILLKQWLSMVTNFECPPTLIRGHLTMNGVIFCCHRWEVPLSFSKLRPRILLDILLCTGRPPPQRPIWPKMLTGLQWNSAQMLKFQIFPGSCHNIMNLKSTLLMFYSQCLTQ